MMLLTGCWLKRTFSFIIRCIALKFFSVGFFKPKEFDFGAKFLIYGLDQSYLHVNTNVEISCLILNNLGIINCIKNLAEKSSSMGLKSLYTKFQLPPRKDKRKYSFLVTSLVSKSSYLWC